MADFFRDVALPFVLGQEGGYKAPDPGDPNPTNLGVTQRTLEHWRAGHPDHPEVPADVRDLKPEHAALIYESAYWIPIQGMALPPAFALLTFDTAVNSGPQVAITLLQAAVGAPVDGDVGPTTRACAATATERDAEDYLWQRLDYDRAAVRHDPAKLSWLPTWCKRLRDLRNAVLPLLNGSP